MHISNARWNASGSAIRATIDGVDTLIPAAPDNRHYGEIVAQGVTVTAYEAPAEPLPDCLTKLQIKREAETRTIASQGGADGWTVIKGFLSGDAAAQEEWDLAVEIDTSDPLVDGIQALFGYAAAEREAFIRAAAAR